MSEVPRKGGVASLLHELTTDPETPKAIGRYLYPKVDGMFQKFKDGTVCKLVCVPSGSAVNPIYVFLLPQPAVGNSTPQPATANIATFGVRSETLLDFADIKLPNFNVGGKLIVVGEVTAGGATGEVRLFNVDDSSVMGTISFTETTPTKKSVALTPIPTTGEKELELQLRKVSGGGTFRVFIAVATLKAVAP